MTPEQLRDLADMVERGDAVADYHVIIQSGEKVRFIGFDEENRAMRRHEEKTVNIEVKMYGRAQVLTPMGHWR